MAGLGQYVKYFQKLPSRAIDEIMPHLPAFGPNDGYGCVGLLEPIIDMDCAAFASIFERGSAVNKLPAPLQAHVFVLSMEIATPAPEP